ncbi:tetratricopeptide repeat protein [Saccharicrinis aurantiacus]|uniref:tetratricopeptide repeat protein n=1 Tax=Saccharicrinis aurantiacus TaxID=1849719 RepID=UPI000837FBB8|nr:tetratricopeptide repeat protein [Saccharicrinis aurantiacus]
MNTIIRFISLCALLLGGGNGYSSSFIKEDSLKFKYKQETLPEEKLKIIIELIRHTRQYDLKKSILFGTEAELLAKQYNREHESALINFEKGISEFYIGNYEEALENNYNAVHYFHDNELYFNLMYSYCNIGAIYDKLENYEEAITLYHQALQNYNLLDKKKQEKSLRAKAQIYNNIASAKERLNLINEAKQYYQKGLLEVAGKNFTDIEASIYNNLGKIEMANGNYNLAKGYLDKSIVLRTELNTLEGLSKSYYFLSNYYSGINNNDSAEWAAKKSLDLSQQINALEPQMVSHMFLYQIYEKENRIAEALEEFKKYKLLSDSLINKQKVTQISQLQVAFEIERLEERNERDKAKMKIQFIIWIIILSALLIVISLLFRISRIQKRRISLENSNLALDVETKDKELTTNVMYLVQKNELLNAVTKDLIDVKQTIKGDQKKAIQKVIYNLQSQSDNEVWQEFEMRFNQVHKDFYEQIRAKHPDISPSEERLCALLRLNMTSKEIAAITHQTVRGVEVARGRLRKRLGLTGIDINIITYLEQF